MGRAFEFRKERKMKRWGNMARVFTKYGKEISMAVKTGGPNPESNSRLRVTIQNAKADNMPKDNIERAIKKASSKDNEDYKEVVYEGYGPHGVAILIETATDNNTRTVANIRSYFNKHNGSLGTQGMLDFMFDRKCRFKISNAGQDIDELELELIDYGVEDVFEDEDGILIYAPFTEFGDIQKHFEEKGIEILNAEFERIPTDMKTITAEQAAEVDKLIEKIEEDEDVQQVYHNMKTVG
ncbi:MAG: YebC/PmpR family DNA-binding transcriptional regulator [Bacteroidales bacterium]|nr:YebC/PmpR family DNA-binding transcriptional regulator [Bacteroidales bacterium]